MVRENTDDRETDSPVAKDGWGVISRVNVYIESLIEEVAEEKRLATDPMTQLAETEKMIVLNKVVRFLHHELSLERQAIVNQLKRDLKQ